MKKIPIAGGYEALVDDDDHTALSKHKWHALRCNGGIYAKRHSFGRGGRQYQMHREILNATVGALVDHINHNTLDNRKANLRIVTPAQSQANRRKQKNNTSGYKGVYWHSQRKKWNPKIQCNGKQKSLGLYASKEEAALAYNKASEEINGEYALLNVISTYKPDHKNL